MGDTTEKVSKPGFFKGVKTEFKKVSWPDKKTMFKQAIAVTSISIVAGIIISILDYLIQNGVNIMTSF